MSLSLPDNVTHGSKVRCRSCGTVSTVGMESQLPVSGARPKSWPTSKPEPPPRPRPKAVSVEVPNRRTLTFTGRYGFDELVMKGLLPPPPPEMAEELRREGMVVRESYPLRFGDLLARITHYLGIPVCTGCSKRRKWFNQHLPTVKTTVWFMVLGGTVLGLYALFVLTF